MLTATELLISMKQHVKKAPARALLAETSATKAGQRSDGGTSETDGMSTTIGMKSSVETRSSEVVGMHFRRQGSSRI